MTCPKRAIEISERAYRWMLRAYPAAYRADYEEPMAQLFRDLLREAADGRGVVGVLGVWWFTLGDLAGSLIVEHRAEWRKAMDKNREAAAVRLLSESLARTLAREFLCGMAVLLLVGSVLKLTSLPLTEGQLLIGLLCACTASLQLTILGVLVTPARVASSQGRLEG